MTKQHYSREKTHRLKHIVLNKGTHPHACCVCTIVLEDPELPFL